MADKPILFSGPMVRALLNGSKTQTRRVLKIGGHQAFSEFGPSDTTGYDWHFRDAAMRWHDFGHFDLEARLPHQRGDRLWVRETWRVGAWRTWQEDLSGGRGDCPVWGDETGCVAVDYLADNHPAKKWIGGDDSKQMMRLIEQSRDDAKADGRFKMDAMFQYRWSPGESPCRIRPPIHMPRWASRLTLIVTDVKILRMQEIGEDQAAATGLFKPYDIPLRELVDSPFRTSFQRAWNARHAKRGYDWNANPWVTVSTATVHRCNIDQMEGTA